VIRTTGEHPFFAYDKGWVKALELAAGDRLLCHDGQWVPVEDVAVHADF
jgi:intein/homing endonuclease